MRLPRTLYDAIPPLYLLIGAVLFALAIEAFVMGLDVSIIFFRFLGGVFLTANALYINKLRKANRKNVQQLSKKVT